MSANTMSDQPWRTARRACHRPNIVDAAKWKACVLRAIGEIEDEHGYFRRRDLVRDPMLSSLRSFTKTKGATPAQTVSRVLQELRDDKLIVFLSRGEYQCLCSTHINPTYVENNNPSVLEESESEWLSTDSEFSDDSDLDETFAASTASSSDTEASVSESDVSMSSEFDSDASDRSWTTSDSDIDSITTLDIASDSSYSELLTPTGPVPEPDTFFLTYHDLLSISDEFVDALRDCLRGKVEMARTNGSRRNVLNVMSLFTRVKDFIATL